MYLQCESEQVNHKNNATIKRNIWAVVPAAGVGRRMGKNQPKQYLEIRGRSIIEHSLDKLFGCKAVAGVAVGIAPDDAYWEKLDIRNKKLLGAFVGGSERVNTVLNGLDFLSNWATGDDWVMVHDAARPCVSLKDINLLIDKSLEFNCSVILASPVTDTVKRVNACNVIQGTVNRDELMLAMTPQLFPVKLLRLALRTAIDNNIPTTDESAAVEKLGKKPLAIRGQRTNIKITTVDDLQLANIFIDEQDSMIEKQ